MDLGLAGKVAVITGATANIGRAIALDFAAEGAKLARKSWSARWNAARKARSSWQRT